MFFFVADFRIFDIKLSVLVDKVCRLFVLYVFLSPKIFKLFSFYSNQLYFHTVFPFVCTSCVCYTCVAPPPKKKVGGGGDFIKMYV